MAELKNKTVLRPYQRRWANDPARFALAVKSAQIGYSTAAAAWAVERCLKIPKRTIIFLSRSEAQSRELGEKAKDWLDGYRGVAADYFPDEAARLGDLACLQQRINFPNGSRIICLAANPDTARGYTGDVVLDEFAFHKDADKIFSAVYRQVSLGFSMRVLSTPNGQRGRFHEIAKQLGLDTGIRPRKQPVRTERVPGSRFQVSGKQESTDAWHLAPDTRHLTPSPWSGHWCDIFLAVEEGAPLDPQEVKAGCDEETWLQEYCCQFISQASDWISPELFQQCVSSEAGVRFQVPGVSSETRNLTPDTCLYAGWDIARKRDLSVIWISELLGDVTWTRGVIEMHNMPTPDQVREARALLQGQAAPTTPVIGALRRMNIDMSGMGLAVYEALAREFPSQVEGVQFTQGTKEAMAVLAKRRMEETKVRIPDDDHIRQSFRSVKKTVNAIGQARFDAEHDTRYGHADHWWAFCLAEAAAEQPVYHLAEVGAVIGKPIAAGMRERVL